MLADYRPTREDLVTAETIECREFLPHDHPEFGPPPTMDEDDFIRVVHEAFRIGIEGKAATIGEAWDSLIADAQKTLDKRYKFGLGGYDWYEKNLEYLKMHRP